MEEKTKIVFLQNSEMFDRSCRQKAAVTRVQPMGSMC